MIFSLGGKNMKKVSVIVPVYNVENYLEECVNSILNQTYEDLEIILVDDGSKDSSGKMCDVFTQKYENVKCVHKENGGLSDARNHGLANATGDYIMFVDSDDYLPEDSIRPMVEEIEKRDADYVVANYQNCNDDGKLWERPVFNLEKYKNFKVAIKDYEDSFYIMNSAVWNKLFRKSFLDEYKMQFVLGVPAEDAIFTMNCFIKSKNVYYIPNVVYYYRQRNSASSISTSCNIKYFNGISKAYKIIYDLFKENNELEFYRFFYAKSMTYIFYKFVDSVLLTDEERIEILTTMRWFYKLSVELDVPACQESLGLIIRKIINGDYRDTIDICKVIAEVRTYMPIEIKETMSKPQREMYSKMMKKD